MKKIIAIVLSAAMTVGIMNVPAYAELTGFKGIGQISVKAASEELTYGDFKYVVENGGVTITKYTGTDSVVTVPDKINGKNVLKIGDNSFCKCKELRKVKFQDNADNNCEVIIGNYVFEGCVNLEQVELSKNISKICNMAFLDCGHLKQIKLPSKLKDLGANVFEGTAIESITIPKTLTKAFEPFEGANNLKEVIIEEGMTEIPSRLLSVNEDNHIQKIIIPSNIESIGDSAFKNCVCLTELKFGENLKHIGWYAFAGCKGLRKISFLNNKDAAFEKTISGCAFSDCTNLEEVNLSDDISWIDREVFYNCSKLKQIKLPSRLKVLGTRAFHGTNIESITIPKTLEKISYRSSENGPLAGAKNLKEIILQEGMQNIPYPLLHLDEKNEVQKIQMPSTIKEIDIHAFWHCKVTIYGYKNSCVETFANTYNIPFISIGVMEIPNLTLQDYDKYQANYLSQNAESITAGQMIYSDLEDNYTPTQYAINNITSFIWNSKFKFSDSSQVWETVLMDTMLRKSYDKEARDTFLKNSAKMEVKVLKVIDEKQGIKETAKLTQENKEKISNTLKDAKIGDVKIMSGMLDAAETTKDFVDKYTKYLELKKEVSSDTTEFLKEMKSTKNYREIPAFQRAVDRIVVCMDTNGDDMLGKLGQAVLKNKTESMLFTESVNTLIENSMDMLLPGMTKVLNFTKDTTMFIMDNVCGVSQLAEVNLYLYMLDCIDESAKEAFNNCAAKNIASNGEAKVNAINGGMQFLIDLQTYGVSVGRKRADQIVKKVLELTTSNSVTTVNNPYRDLVNARLNLKTGSKREEKKKYIENKCQENEKWITGVKNLKTFAFLNWYEETNTDDNMALLMFVVENPDGSKNIYAKQKAINTKIEFPTPEAKTGYTASKSWYTDEECKHTVSGSQTVSGNAIFYTKYTHNILFDKKQKGEIKINKFDGTYYLNGKNTGKTRAVQNAKKCEIPSYIDGYKVTELGEDIFSELPDMTEIYIPPTVKTINKDAFKSLPKETLYRCDKKSYAEDFLHDNKYKNVRVEDNTPKPKTAKVSQIKLAGISNKIAAGKKIKLTATINPKNATKKTLKWTTNNKKLATVDKNGVVTLNKKAGGKTVKITVEATDGSKKKATFTIKIMKGVVKKVKISGSKTVKAGKTLKLKAKVTASKGANKSLKWTSSNTKYATVTSSGKVKALKAGKKKIVKITAMAVDGSGKKATFKVKIK